MGRARPPSPILAATTMVSLSPTPLADFCNQNGTRAHRPNAKTSLGVRLSPTPMLAQVSPRAANNANSRAKTPVRAGRTSMSQRTRSGAVAHSSNPEHLIVTTSLPQDLESLVARGSSLDSPPHLSRERLKHIGESRCFPLSQCLTGELLP